MAFQKDSDAEGEITQTYVTRSHAAPMLTNDVAVADVSLML